VSNGGLWRLLLVDDHDVVRMGLRAMLATDRRMKVIAEGHDGEEAIALYREHQPDLVLMDVRMPGMDGIKATRRLCGEFPDAIVVMLTTFDGDEDIHRALAAGARSYLLKSMTGPDFLAALHRILAGQRYLPPAVASRLAERTPCADLTAKEHEVLRLLGRGFGNREMAEVLGVSENTVKTHLKVIYAKLDVNGRAEAISVALQRGILHVE